MRDTIVSFVHNSLSLYLGWLPRKSRGIIRFSSLVVSLVVSDPKTTTIFRTGDLGRRFQGLSKTLTNEKPQFSH
jgi:hypothetical protein